MMTTAEVSELAIYLDLIGGKDILYFETSDDATEAANRIRRDAPDVQVRASYNKVYLDGALD